MFTVLRLFSELHPRTSRAKTYSECVLFDEFAFESRSVMLLLLLLLLLLMMMMMTSRPFSCVSVK